MLTHSVNGPALRRLESVPEVEGAEAWRLFVEHHEPKQASRFLGKLRGILTRDIGHLGQVVSKYRDQSGEGVSDSLLQATLQAGTQEESMRDHLALHTGAMGHLRDHGPLQSMSSHAQGLEDRSVHVPMGSQPSRGTGKAKDLKSNDRGEVSKVKEQRKQRSTRRSGEQESGT